MVLAHSERPENRRTSHALAPILWVAWTLLLFRIGALSLWIDEWFTVSVARTPWGRIMEHIVATERRPPLHYVLLKLWIILSGDSEYAMRLFSAMLAVLSVAVLYALGRQLIGHRVGLVAALLLAISPFFILYGRMVRAYSLVMLLGTLATWALVRAIKQPTFGRWAIYGATALALLYTDYSGLAVLGAHALYMLVVRSANRRPLRAWLITILIVGLGYLPWLPTILAHRAHPVRLTDLATGFTGLALKLAYPFYAWGAGETIFPWHPAALPGALASGVFLLFGFVSQWRCGNRETAWLLATTLAVPLAFTALLLTFVATDIPFLNAASRSPAAAPIFYLGVASGWCALRAHVWRVLGTLCIAAAFAGALANYYRGEQFHNPIYAVPIRQVVEQVRAASAPDDLIIAEADTLFGYYYQRAPGQATYQDIDPSTNRAVLEAQRPRRVWLVTYGRDSTAEVANQTQQLTEWMAEHYRLAQTQGYVPQDALYRRVKAFLLRRSAYDYKLLVRIYEIKP